MRTCTKCKVNEPRNKTSSYCAKCHSEYQKMYYRKHPDNIIKSQLERRKKLRDFIIEAKNKPCVDCKKKFPYYVMDFDHINGEKKFNLSTGANKLFSLQTIINEIKKCEIVCANCHRERTFNRDSEIV